MVVHMRHTRAHTANRRSHHALVRANLVVCKNCSALHMRHRVCTGCGVYRGRVVVDMVKKTERAQARLKKKEELRK